MSQALDKRMAFNMSKAAQQAHYLYVCVCVSVGGWVCGWMSTKPRPILTM